MEFLLWLQEIRTPFVENAALVISLLCDKILIMLVFCWIFWCRDKKWAYSLALSFAISGLLVQGTKLAFRIDRPFVRDLSIKPVSGAIETATGYSFPSGHTQVATSILGFTAVTVKNPVTKVVSVIIILMVMLSRIVLGVHTPLDVIVSFLITAAVVLCVKFFADAYVRYGCVIGVLVSFVGLLYCIYLILSGQTQYVLAHDGVVTMLIGMAFFFCRYVETRFIDFDPAATFSGKNSIAAQLLKFVVGFAGVAVIYFCFSCFDNPFVDGCKYIAVFTWICALYPLVIKNLCKRV